MTGNVYCLYTVIGNSIEELHVCIPDLSMVLLAVSIVSSVFDCDIYSVYELITHLYGIVRSLFSRLNHQRHDSSLLRGCSESDAQFAVAHLEEFL